MASQAVKALVKRNVALVLGFQGTRYHGLQMAPQPGIPTIEAAVHDALHAAGAISDCNNGDRNKIKVSICALMYMTPRRLASHSGHSLLYLLH
jgi:hypothetical protein